MQHGPLTKAESKAQSQRDKAANRKAQNKVIGKINKAPKKKGIKGDVRGRDTLYSAPAESRRTVEQPGLRSQTIAEDEFVCTLYGGVAALLGPALSTGVQNVIIQPALPVAANNGGGFASWGRQVAALYESYTVEKMEFYYRPLVSAFSTQGTAGKIVMGVDYESTESLPTTVAMAESNDPHVDGMAYEKLSLVLDPRRLTPNPKFTRVAGVPGSDSKLYDAGRLFFVATGMASGSDTIAIGELRVRYKLRFHNPRLPVPVTTPNNALVAYTNLNAWTFTNNTPQVVVMADLLGSGPYNLPNRGYGVQNIIGVTPAADGSFAISAFAYKAVWSLTITHGASVGTQLLIYIELLQLSGAWLTFGNVPYQNVIGPTAGAFSLTLPVLIDGSVSIGALQQIVGFRCRAISYFPSSTATAVVFSSSLVLELMA